jgi:8-oxo-dGTP diphosphatase
MEFNASLSESVQQFYGNRLRVRACGLHLLDDRLLMIRHNLGAGNFWSPPGGGIEVGETAIACLRREWKEETGLQIGDCDFLFGCELLRKPLHAIELFFMIHEVSGELKTGHDPEQGSPKVILETRYLSWSKIASINKAELHGIFRLVGQPHEILDLRGYFTV